MSSTRHIPDRIGEIGRTGKDNDKNTKCHFPRKCHVPRKKTTRYRYLRGKIRRPYPRIETEKGTFGRRTCRKKRYSTNNHLQLGIYHCFARFGTIAEISVGAGSKERSESFSQRIIPNAGNVPVDLFPNSGKMSIATSGSVSTFVADGVAYYNRFLTPLDESVLSLGVAVRREGPARCFFDTKGGVS